MFGISRVTNLDSYRNSKEARESNFLFELTTAVTRILEISNSLDRDLRTIMARAKHVPGSKTESEAIKEKFSILTKIFEDSYLQSFLDKNGLDISDEKPPLNFSAYRNSKIPKPEVVHSFEKNLDNLIKLIDECRSLSQVFIEKNETNSSEHAVKRNIFGVNRLSDVVTRVLNDDRYSKDVKEIFLPILGVLS
jgi:hypothetical protein